MEKKENGQLLTKQQPFPSSLKQECKQTAKARVFLPTFSDSPPPLRRSPPVSPFDFASISFLFAVRRINWLSWDDCGSVFVCFIVVGLNLMGCCGFVTFWTCEEIGALLWLFCSRTGVEDVVVEKNPVFFLVRHMYEVVNTLWLVGFLPFWLKVAWLLGLFGHYCWLFYCLCVLFDLMCMVGLCRAGKLFVSWACMVWAGEWW